MSKNYIYIQWRSKKKDIHYEIKIGGYAKSINEGLICWKVRMTLEIDIKFVVLLIYLH